ncbi:MAG: rhodanese-like domain-containing protein [Myxococcales bacterium]
MKIWMIASAALLAAGQARADEAPLTFITTADLHAKTVAAPPTRWAFTVIDARTRVEFEENHIAGAISCPATQTAALLPRLVKDKSHRLIFYCNGPKCTKSQKAARVAMSLGYHNVLEYNEGLPAWGKANLPVAGSPMPAAEMASISPEDLRARMQAAKGLTVVDVRDAVEFASVRVAGTVNLPLDELEKRARELPAGELVVMDHGGGQSLIAGRVLQKAGRSGASRLEGGLLAWQQKGLPVEEKALAERR